MKLHLENIIQLNTHIIRMYMYVHTRTHYYYYYYYYYRGRDSSKN